MSPEQISALLAKDGDGPQVSVESIYQALYCAQSPFHRSTKLRTDETAGHSVDNPTSGQVASLYR